MTTPFQTPKQVSTRLTQNNRHVKCEILRHKWASQHMNITIYSPSRGSGLHYWIGKTYRATGIAQDRENGLTVTGTLGTEVPYVIHQVKRFFSCSDKTELHPGTAVLRVETRCVYCRAAGAGVAAGTNTQALRNSVRHGAKFLSL